MKCDGDKASHCNTILFKYTYAYRVMIYKYKPSFSKNSKIVSFHCSTDHFRVSQGLSFYIMYKLTCRKAYCLRR